MTQTPIQEYIAMIEKSKDGNEFFDTIKDEFISKAKNLLPKEKKFHEQMFNKGFDFGVSKLKNRYLAAPVTELDFATYYQQFEKK